VGLIAPWFLLGIAAVGLPLYLHLLRRNTSTPQPFSSLRFFEPRRISSVRHRRLRYLLLLALRLALLALVVLAFARPFINRPVALVGADRLQLLLIDESFSMRAGSRLDDARRAALSVLAHRGASERAQVMAFGSRLQVLTPVTGDAATLRAAVSGVEAEDSRGNLGEVVNAVREAAGSVHAPIEVHLFSDMQQSNLPASLEALALPAEVTLILHPVVESNVPNWTVEGVTAPAQLWGSVKQVKPSQVQAIVAGYGTPGADRSATLIVNGRAIATQPVHVPAAGRAAVSFTLPVIPYGFSRCEVRIDSADVLPEDDSYRFAIQRSDPQQVLFVHAPSDARSPLYFGNALTAADGAQFDLQSVSVAQAALRSLKPYAFVVLSNAGTLSELFENQLLAYVRAGGSVLLTLGAGPATHVPVFGETIQETRNYSAGFAAGRERFAGVSEVEPSQPWAGDPALWSGVKFFYAQRVQEGNSQVLVRLTDRTPLLLEKRIGEGRVLLLASGLEGLTNDLPLHPAFVALVSQLANHLSALSQDRGARLVDSMLPLREEPQPGAAGATGVEVIDPSGARPLSLTETATAPSLRLRQAGFYQLRLANGRQELVAVNIDPRESDLAVIPAEELSLWQHRPAAQPATPASQDAASHRAPYGLWWFILLAALAAALGQVWVAARHLDTQREQT
jgi:hypothetical protein